MTGQISLETAEISIGEADGVVYIPIVRTGDLSGAVNIEWATTNDTATTADYAGTSGIARMAAGQDRVLIAVSITNDNVREATETFVLSIINVDSGFLQFPRTSRIEILDDESPVTDPAEPPLVSDYEVDQQAIITGLTQPIAFEFLPANDRLMVVAEKSGLIEVYNTATGQLSSTLLDLRGEVNNVQDRGLLDIAFHPDLDNNPYLYAFYVVDPSQTQGRTGNAGPDGAGNRYSHVARFTLDEATGYTTVVANSKVVLLGGAGTSLSDISGGGAIDSTSNLTIRASDINPTTGEYIQDYIKVDSRSHAGGSIEFGPDGALYVATGDGTSFNATDPRTVSVLDTDSLAGKVLRVDPLTGRGLADNPFVEPGTDLNSNAAKVYQLGFRNPFSMSFDAEGQLIVTNTGWNTYEALFKGGPGANFGWPFYEGGDKGTLLQTNGYKNLPEAQAFYAAVARGDIEITAAFRAFGHASSVPGFQVQAISGADDIINSGRYPDALQGHYIFTDVSQGEVFSVDINDRRDVQFLYKTDNGFGPVHLKQGPDGYMYYADLVTGQIGRLLITDPSGEIGNFVNDNPAANQELTGTAGIDAFVLEGATNDYGYGLTADQTGIVVWQGSRFDILRNFEFIEFADELVDVRPLLQPPSGNVIDDIAGVTQFVDGPTADDTFAVNDVSTNYGWGLTQDQQGIVVWSGSNFDILTNVETLQFTDRSIDLTTFFDGGGGNDGSVADIANQTQYLQGTSGTDIFVIDGTSTDYQWGRTADDQDHVVWGPTGFDLLYDWEQIRFNDTVIDLV